MKKKYHLVTYHPTENGYDDKEDVNTMAEATKLAKRYLSMPEYYDSVYVFNETENKLQRVFDQFSKNGRKPYESEIQKFQY